MTFKVKYEKAGEGVNTVEIAAKSPDEASASVRKVHGPCTIITVRPIKSTIAA